MNYFKNYLTNNDCYKKNQKITKVYGILVHSTGANNPFIKRYVQPDINGIGKNIYDNDWNRPGIEKCVHAFIGKLENGDIATVNTLPYDVCAWGSGQGPNGSFNYNPTAKIHFEICEDDLTNRDYFDKVMKEAQEYCAYLCKEFNLNIDKITDHAEAYKLGFATNHSDIGHWLVKFGLDMNWFRGEVQKLLEETPIEPPTPPVPPVPPIEEGLKVGDKVEIVGPYASSSTSLIAINKKGIGWTRYITRILEGRRFPYQVGNEGKTDGKNTTGFAKETSLRKIT